MIGEHGTAHSLVIFTFPPPESATDDSERQEVPDGTWMRFNSVQTYCRLCIGCPTMINRLGRLQAWCKVGGADILAVHYCTLSESCKFCPSGSSEYSF